MNHMNFCSKNYGSTTSSKLNGQQSSHYSNTAFWSSSSNMNSNHPMFSLNPQASPFQTSYPPTANYFNLTSIAKSKTDSHNNISKPIQKLNSEIRSSFSSLSQKDQQKQNSSSNTNKKHKREHKLEDLQKILKDTKEDIYHYERKRKRLIEDLEKIKEELRSCDSSLDTHRNKLKNIQIDIEKEKRKQNENFQSPHTTNSLTPPSTNHLSNNSSSSSNHSPVNASVNSINNLNINSKTNKVPNKSTTNLANKQINAQFTIKNIITNLLEKKIDVDFPKFDYIFTVEEEIFEPKPIDFCTKYEINLVFKKLLSSEEKKSGFRYIIRGCIYDSKSDNQSDNLSFVKSYEFLTATKKHTYENHDLSSNKLMFPFDITDYCRFDKKLTIFIHLNKKLIENKKVAFGVYFVKRLDYNQTLELVRKNEIIRKKSAEITKNQVTNAFDQSAGIQMDSYKIALIDPLSKAKISMPCIGETCEHIAIFDGLTFLESNSKKFSWFCPICGRPIGYNQLFYDELIKEILKKVSMDCTAIAFDKMSNWMPLSDSNNKKEKVEEDDDCITLE